MDSEKLKEVKKMLKAYTDFYGSELISRYEIDDAKNVLDLEEIIERHRDFIIDQSTDACAEIDRFKKSLGVF